MAEWEVSNPVIYAPDGDDIDSAWQKEIAQVNKIYEYLNRLRTYDAGAGASVADAVAYSVKIDTSTTPATIYMRNAENNGYIKLGTLEKNLGITGSEIGSVDAEGFGKMTMGKSEKKPSTANPKDLYFAYDEKKIYIWNNGGWEVFLSLDYSDIANLDNNVLLSNEVALSGANKVLRLDDSGKANVDITGSPARIDGRAIDVSSLSDGDVLQYNASAQTWKNVPKDELTEAGDVSSTGAPGKIVRADTYGNVNANAKVIATKQVTMASSLKDGDALVYDRTADAFLNKPVAVTNSSGVADISITGNAAKIAGVPVKTDDNLSDGQIFVYRAAQNAIVNESKSAAGAGKTLYVKNDGNVIATYNGDATADVDISKALYDTAFFRQPNTEYKVGDLVQNKGLVNGMLLKCTTAGTTSVQELDCGTATAGNTLADGSVVWTVEQTLVATGNAATATKLAAARTIALSGDATGSATFDGSGDATIATTLVRGAGLTHLIPNNAGAHNAIYRGKNLGAAVTDAQWAAIKAGTFDDLFIGDYWTIGDVNWRIAAFDYWLHCGDTECTTHHVVIVPDTSLANAQMNSTNVTDGGYVGSNFYTGANNNTGKATAVSAINSAFGSSHILNHREYLTNAVTDGKPTGGDWYDSTVELMSEAMVYGAHFFEPNPNGQNPWSKCRNYTIDKTQLPLFAHDPSRITNRDTWWLRGVVTAAVFAYVSDGGLCDDNIASSSLGVRPAFGIK